MQSPGHSSEKGITDRDGDIGFVDTGAVAAGQSWFFSRAGGGPRSTLAIYRNRLLISGGLFEPYEFARGDVTKVAVQGLVSRYVRIYHTRRDYPPYITFSPLSFESVIEGFRRVGYPIEYK
jgi:hypothetical protein